MAKKSDYRTKLQDIEYSEHAKIKPEDFHSKEANMSLLKELLKDRADSKDQPKEKSNIMPNEDDKTAGSPISTGPGPVKGNPHPATLQGFKQ